MKRYIVITALLFSVWSVQAQNGQHIAEFSQFQHYYNPALTGYSGSAIKSFYRDRWTSVENSPLTVFVSGEMNLADLNKADSKKLQHAFGVSAMYDTYGTSTDKSLALTYSTGLKISELFHLRAGAALTYNNMSTELDNGLVFGNGSDPVLADLGDNNKLNKYGLNLGAALTAADFYVGYAAADLVQTENSDSEYFKDRYALQHIVQAGYRRMLTKSFGLTLNALYRYDKNMKGTAEGQLKGVYKNTLWLGAGYRNELAYTINAGAAFNQFRIGYSREIAAPEVNGFYRGSNEITLSYNLSRAVSKGKGLSIW